MFLLESVHQRSLSALAYAENGHGISLGEFSNHSIMVFDLTSTQEGTHDFIHPETTNSTISVELKFDTALTNKALPLNHLRCIFTLQETYPKMFYL